MHDGNWRFIIPHDKEFITESYPPDDLFPHGFISKSIDDVMKRTSELLGWESLEKYLRTYLYIMEECDPRLFLSIIMA